MLVLHIDAKKIRFLALFLAILGLAFLYFALSSEYAQAGVLQAKGMADGKKVFVTGFADAIEPADWGAKVTLCDAGKNCISVKVGKGVYDTAFLSKGGIIRVWGSISEYMGGRSIEAGKVERD